MCIYIINICLLYGDNIYMYIIYIYIYIYRLVAFVARTAFDIFTSVTTVLQHPFFFSF